MWASSGHPSAAARRAAPSRAAGWSHCSEPATRTPHRAPASRGVYVKMNVNIYMHRAPASREALMLT